MTTPGWGGRRAQEWTAAVLREYGDVCHLRLPGCTLVATTGDHVIPQAEAPHLRYVVANGRPACAACNSRRQARPLADVRAETTRPVIDARDFFDVRPAGNPAPSFRFLPETPTKSDEVAP